MPVMLAIPLRIGLLRAPRELDTLIRERPAAKCLSLGVVDGRNIWRNDFAATLPLLEKAAAVFGPDRLLIAPSCSLQHVPVTLRHETKLDPEFKSWLAFAEEKLAEVVTLRDLVAGAAPSAAFTANRTVADARRTSPRIHRPAEVIFVQALPENATGKVDRKKLRALLAA